jgi:hypothetical protein
MSKSPEDAEAEELERNKLKVLIGQAFAEIERREEQARVLREENARLKRLSARVGRHFRGK